MKNPSSERHRGWRGELTLSKVIKSSKPGRQRRVLAPFLGRSKLVLAEEEFKYIYKKGCLCLLSFSLIWQQPRSFRVRAPRNSRGMNSGRPQLHTELPAGSCQPRGQLQPPGIGNLPVAGQGGLGWHIPGQPNPSPQTSASLL